MDKSGFLPLIRGASKIFDAPIIFTDEHYNLISLYPEQKIGDSVYDTLLESGTLSIDTIVAFQQSYLGEEGLRYEPFYVKEGLVKDAPRIFAEVYDEEKVLGHIGIFISAEKACPWHLEAAAILTRILKIKLKLTKHLTHTLSGDLQDLLNRYSHNHVKEKAKVGLAPLIKNSGILIVAPLGQSKAQQAFASVARNHCLNEFPTSIPVIHNNDLVILVTNNKKESFFAVQKIAEEIAAFLDQYKVSCGAVYPIDDLYLFPNYYIQGRLTALLDTKNNKLTYYDEVAPEPLYLYLSEIMESYSFIHPMVRIIREYDKENHTDFFQTLKTFCQCLFYKNETSQKLHIHRNTLLYRLNRMEELFSLNLKDFRTLHHLMISFELEKYESN